MVDVINLNTRKKISAASALNFFLFSFDNTQTRLVCRAHETNKLACSSSFLLVETYGKLLSVSSSSSHGTAVLVD